MLYVRVFKRLGDCQLQVPLEVDVKLQTVDMTESVLQKQLEPLSPGIHLAGDGRVMVWRGQTGVSPHPHMPPEGTQTPLRVGRPE